MCDIKIKLSNSFDILQYGLFKYVYTINLCKLSSNHLYNNLYLVVKIGINGLYRVGINNLKIGIIFFIKLCVHHLNLCMNYMNLCINKSMYRSFEPINKSFEPMYKSFKLMYRSFESINKSFKPM